MKMKRLIFLSLFFILNFLPYPPLWAEQNFPPLNIPENETVDVIDQHALIVTHAGQGFDYDLSAKNGIDETIFHFKKHLKPVIYLMARAKRESYSSLEEFEYLTHLHDTHLWYTEDRSPTIGLSSINGMHTLPLRTNAVTIVGGYFGGCHRLSIKSAIQEHFNYSDEPFSIHLVANAIYVHASHSHTVSLAEQMEEANQELFVNTFWEMNPIFYNNLYTGQLFIDGELLDTRGVGRQNVSIYIWHQTGHPLINHRERVSETEQSE